MLKLLKRNIVKRFISWKTIVLMIVGLGTMFTCYQHVPGRDGIHLSYLILEGPFAVFYQVVSPQNSTLIASVLLAIMILYFMESPIINQDDRFFIIRTGKKPWIITEMIGIFCSSVIWILLINIMGCISSYNHMDWADYHIYTSNMKCMLIYLLAYTCIGLLILLFHLLNIKALGTAVMVTLFLLENFILDVLPNNISVFSDSADSGKILSVIKKFTFMNRMENGYMGDSFLTSILYFGIIIVVLVQLNLTYAGKHEIG